jgi:hypothetical protein
LKKFTAYDMKGVARWPPLTESLCYVR